MNKTITQYNSNLLVKVNDPNEHIQSHWMRGNFYETQRNGLLSYINNTCPKGLKKIVDVGASIGNHTLFFSRVMNAHQVISFEPDHDSFKHLVENVKLNGMEQAKPFQYAIGEKEGVCAMQLISQDNIGMKQVREDMGGIPIVSLDMLDFVQDYDIIKIDVEHYNKKLLIGAEKTFTNGNGIIFIECESIDERNEADHYLNKYGYMRESGLTLNHTPTYKYTKRR